VSTRRALALAFVATLVAAFGVGLWASSIALARCRPLRPREEARMAESVFVGELTSVSDQGLTFRVRQVYKGSPGREITLAQSGRRPMASDAQVGQRFLIFAVRYGGLLQIHRCGNSRQLSPGQALPADLAAVLGAPHAP
jgi:hypothetical protein